MPGFNEYGTHNNEFNKQYKKSIVDKIQEKTLKARIEKDENYLMHILKKAKDDASVVASLAVGDELHITGVDKTYYKCTFGKKTGYVSESSVVVIKKGHGDVNPGYVGSNCWIKYENTFCQSYHCQYRH